MTTQPTHTPEDRLMVLADCCTADGYHSMAQRIESVAAQIRRDKESQSSLSAAVPEMLKALKLTMRMCQEWSTAYKLAEAAIAKAEGME